MQPFLPSLVTTAKGVAAAQTLGATNIQLIKPINSFFSIVLPPFSAPILYNKRATKNTTEIYSAVFKVTIFSLEHFFVKATPTTQMRFYDCLPLKFYEISISHSINSAN